MNSNELLQSVPAGVQFYIVEPGSQDYDHNLKIPFTPMIALGTDGFSYFVSIELAGNLVDDHGWIVTTNRDGDTIYVAPTAPKFKTICKRVNVHG